MNKIYLAINYGSEGWSLTEYKTPTEALNAVKDGDTYGTEWKIFKELQVKIVEEGDDENMGARIPG